MVSKKLVPLNGFHHVTAVTGNISENLRFYTGVLGMRLVKKTVNQDDISAYHLFYGDQYGSPGTELTFFEWPHAGYAVDGTGTIGAIGLRVASDKALGWWLRRFDEHGVPHSRLTYEGGQTLLRFRDPDGQRLELIDDDGAVGGTPWTGGSVPPDMAIRGLHSVTLVVRQLGPTASNLVNQLGFRQCEEYMRSGDAGLHVVHYESGAGGPGTYVKVETGPNLPTGRSGIGGVHHAAFRVADDSAQLLWMSRLAKDGVQVTSVIDRYYFKSIYFHEPGRILFEIATDGPGMMIDEDLDNLGDRLSLPPFLEPDRERIEAGLQLLL